MKRSRQPKARAAYISRRTLTDRKVRELSFDAKAVWMALLMHPHGSMVPGFIPDSVANLGETLGKDVTAAVAEIVEAGILLYDPGARLFWQPNGVHHNEPENPNVIVGWAKQVPNLPDSDLVDQAAPLLLEVVEARAAEAKNPENWREAIDTLREVFGMDPANGPETVAETVQEGFADGSETVRATIRKPSSSSSSSSSSSTSEGASRARACEPPPLDPEPPDDELAGGSAVSESATTDDGTATGFVEALYDQAAMSCDLPARRRTEAQEHSARIAAITHRVTGASSMTPAARTWWSRAFVEVVKSRRGGFLKGKSYVRLSWLVKRFDDGTSPVERAAIGDYGPEKRKRDPPRRRDRADELFESVREEEARAEGVIDVEYELDEEYAG